MEQTEKLMHDISNTEGHTAQLEQDTKTVDSELTTIHDQLEISEEVNNSLHKLDTALSTASTLLEIVSIIPEIGTEASELKRTIDTFHEPVKGAVTASDKVEKVVKPVRTKIEQLEPKVKKCDELLLETMNTENKMIDILGSAQHCINTLPDSSVKTDLAQKMDAASETFDPAVLTFDKAQVTILNGIEAAKKDVDKLKDWASGLVSLNAQIQSVMNVLSPLINSLQAIANAFKQVVRVPYGGYPKICYKKVLFAKVPYPCGWHTVYFSFSIDQILHGITGVLSPVMDLLNKAMDAILNPLLKALNLNITLPQIPGLSILSDIEAHIEDTFAAILKPLDALFADMALFSDFIKKLEDIIEKISDINKACHIHVETKEKE